MRVAVSWPAAGFLSLASFFTFALGVLAGLDFFFAAGWDFAADFFSSFLGAGVLPALFLLGIFVLSPVIAVRESIRIAEPSHRPEGDCCASIRSRVASLTEP